MHLKFWQTKRFKEIEKRWYEKLRGAGFQDCEEQLLNGELFLRQYSYRRKISQVERESKLAYFDLLGAKIYEEQFKDPADKLIMERRANGVMIKKISEELKTLGMRCHRETIRHVIRKYEIKWGIRKIK